MLGCFAQARPLLCSGRLVRRKAVAKSSALATEKPSLAMTIGHGLPAPLLAEIPCRHHAIPSAPHSALAWPLIPHGATRRAPPGARQGLPERPGGPIHGKTARPPWPAEALDCSRLIFRGPVSGRLASSRRKAPANRAAHRRPLDCSRPGLVRARVRLRLTPARVLARVARMEQRGIRGDRATLSPVFRCAPYGLL